MPRERTLERRLFGWILGLTLLPALIILAVGGWAVANSLDRKVCNTLNTLCLTQPDTQVPAALRGLARAADRQGKAISGLFLDSYPGMTEASLDAIARGIDAARELLASALLLPRLIDEVALGLGLLHVDGGAVRDPARPGRERRSA